MIYIQKHWYFSCQLVTVERFQAWGGLSTFHVEIFSVWMSQRQVQKLRAPKDEKLTQSWNIEIKLSSLEHISLFLRIATLILASDNLIFKFCWSDQFWKQNYQIKVLIFFKSDCSSWSNFAIIAWSGKRCTTHFEFLLMEI